MSDRFDPAAWQRRVRVSRGLEPADLLIAGATIVNVFSGELLEADVAIVDGRIAGVGAYPDARERVGASGSFLAPSFIDAHIHLESSLLLPAEFARAVVPHGTGAVVTDPHEIANVAGLPGVVAFRTLTTGLPLHIRFTAPSCIPASRHESSGATMNAAAIADMLAWPETVGLGEMMNFPGVLAGDTEIAEKLAGSQGRRRDGHAPGLIGADLQAYASGGIHSDHEATALDEARAKLRAGLMIMIREGSTEHNLLELLPLVNDETYPRCCFASDDRDGHTLLHDGHMDATLRTAVAAGLDPVRAIRMATWNAADYWRLDGIGAIAPGYEANLVLLRDLAQFEVIATYFHGRLVASHGSNVGNVPVHQPNSILRNTVNVAPVMLRDLQLPIEQARTAIEVISGQIVTRAIEVTPIAVDGLVGSDPSVDLLKMVCVERHHATGRIGTGLVKGFGLKRGAMASSIAHDAHNIVAIGVDDVDLLAAIATVAESQGGLAIVADGQVLGHLPLPICGLLSDQPLTEVAAAYEDLERMARQLGSRLPSPFGLLAFLALSVIPEARITDRGFLRVG